MYVHHAWSVHFCKINEYKGPDFNGVSWKRSAMSSGRLTRTDDDEDLPHLIPKTHVYVYMINIPTYMRYGEGLYI